ncbi:hypothetical protein PCASD_09679, partial [Puccinia coronata f. sp. avenae]
PANRGLHLDTSGKRPSRPTCFLPSARQKSSFNQVICENTETSVRTRRQKQRLEESPPPSAEPLKCDELQFSPGCSDDEKYLICSSPRNSLKLWGFKTEEILPGVGPKVAPTSSSSYEADLNLESPSACLKWVKRELMGCGSFGSVYLALNLTNQEMMAVKQIQIGHQSSTRPFVKSALEAIKLEICFLKDLKHPNIVQFLGFEETPQNYNIFLEYVAGGSIGSCVSKNGKLEPEVVKSFTKQILKGLEYLHNLGFWDLEAVQQGLSELRFRSGASDPDFAHPQPNPADTRPCLQMVSEALLDPLELSGQIPDFQKAVPHPDPIRGLLDGP